MSAADLRQIQEALQADENKELRNSIYAAFLEDNQRGAEMIISFASKQNITLLAQDVIDQLKSMDDDEVDVELTSEMLAGVAGGDKCTGG